MENGLRTVVKHFSQFVHNCLQLFVHNCQGRDVRVPAPGATSSFLCGRSTGANDFAYSPGKSDGSGVANNFEKECPLAATGGKI